MKTRFLLAPAMALLLTGSLTAQTNITPARYIFADQPEGIFQLDEALTGANPPDSYVNVVNNWHDGYVVINNGQFGAGLTGAPNAMYIQSGTSIVDLGGEVGKVLCIKGADSQFEYGTAANGAFNIGWWNMSFFTDPVLTPVLAPVRFKVVFKIIENTPDLANGQFATQAYTYANNHNPLSATFGSGDFIERWEDDGSPKEDENGNLINDETLWIEHETDHIAETEAGVPLRLAFKFSNQAKFPNSTFLIKSIDVILNPEGDPVAKKEINLIANPTGIKEILDSQLQYAIQGNQITFKNVPAGERVNIYSVSGSLVEMFISNGSEENVTLTNGIYLVKAGSKVTKLIVK